MQAGHQNSIQHAQDAGGRARVASAELPEGKQCLLGPHRVEGRAVCVSSCPPVRGWGRCTDARAQITADGQGQ